MELSLLDVPREGRLQYYRSACGTSSRTANTYSVALLPRRSLILHFEGGRNIVIHGCPPRGSVAVLPICLWDIITSSRILQISTVLLSYYISFPTSVSLMMCAHPHVLRNALIRWQLHVIWLLLVQVSGEALKSRTQGDPTNTEML